MIGINPAQIRVVSGVGVKAVLVDWVCTVTIVVIGLTVTAKAAHDGVVIAPGKGWESLHDSVCGLIITEVVNIVAFRGVLE